MALFRTVKTTFWEDAKVIEEFSPEDRYFFLYLLTNPHSTQLGIYKFVPRIAAFHLGYSIEAVKTLLERFENSYKMIRFSHSTNEVAIKNYLRHSIIKGGKPVLDCLKKEERDIQNKDLVYYVVNHVSKDGNLNNTVRQFIEYFNEKENDNDNDNENENERYEDVTYNVTSTIRQDDSDSTPKRGAVKEVIDLYHNLCPSLPKVRKVTQKRASAINARLKTYGIDEIKECFTKAEKSRFLKGGNDRNWNADFDWLMKESNMAKVLEGKYDDREVKPTVKPVKNKFNDFDQRTYDYEDLEKRLHRQAMRNMP